MLLGTIKALALLVAAILICPGLTSADNTLSETGNQRKLSILRKLDFSKVGFPIKTRPEMEKTLRDRALNRLKQAGLKPVSVDYKGFVEARLILTLNPIPLDAICPGKFLYDRKLELSDDVVLKRDPEINIERVSWSLAPATPEVVGQCR